MPWTYTGDPQHVARDAVRFWSGDTVSTATITLQDGEVDYTISMEPDNARLAAALCCDALASRYASKASITVGEVSRSNGDRAKVFYDRATQLRYEAGKNAIPFFGGQSVADKSTLAGNIDAVPQHFGLGQFDNPLSRQFDNQPPDSGYTQS